MHHRVPFDVPTWGFWNAHGDMHGAVCPQCIMRGGLLLSTVTNRDRVAVWDTTLENNIHVLMFKNQANKLVHNTNIKTDFIVHNTLHMFSNYIYIYIYQYWIQLLSNSLKFWLCTCMKKHLFTHVTSSPRSLYLIGVNTTHHVCSQSNRWRAHLCDQQPVAQE